MKKLYLFLISVLFSCTVFAQQDAQFTQNMFTNMFVNPGYAGINKQICITTLFRQQWTGFTSTYTDQSTQEEKTYKSSPQTILLTIDAPIRALHGGLGGSVFNDKLGAENNLGVRLAYSFHVNIAIGTLGIGLQAGFLNKSIDFSKFNPLDPNDPLLMNNSGKKSLFITDIAFGLFYNIPGKAYVGISSNQLIESKLKLGDQFNSKLKRHYYLTGGYHWNINPEWELSPYVLIKTDFASAQYDIAALVKWKNMIWGGVAYRVQDAVAIIVGAYPLNQPSMSPALQNLRIGYSYDITTSALGKNKRSSGSHEVMLGYCFKIEPKKYVTKYINTRFL
ncbi:MAG: type IX secretion system membrane protein PorP/SprF [Bacteroidales bacterium]|jgi:type IX secretion system PorP/SprF family membrane protein|nr:type IX secretion system membrane protein PorP/SprF [Bacteroidales bacterium]MDD4214594.1 type IX secretion system membrane protein PorP/SprF [Bacteroidales bacterium]